MSRQHMLSLGLEVKIAYSPTSQRHRIPRFAADWNVLGFVTEARSQFEKVLDLYELLFWNQSLFEKVLDLYELLFWNQSL